MDRLKIMVGDKKVIQRFIGDKLVWENIILLLSKNNVYSIKHLTEVYLLCSYEEDIEIKNITKMVIGNVEVTNFQSLEGGKGNEERGEWGGFKFTPTEADFDRIPEGMIDKLEIWGRG
mgnify:CR=1 FL=1|jgi:hypothetical protein